ncbi:MAG TPA: hypothetical protein VIN07_02545 [Flavipsychrobacter sp.]
MLKRITHIVFSVFMSFLLLFGGVSKEYLHLFADHTDTESCNHHREGLYFESEHHHCDFLSYTLPYYVHDAAVYTLPVTIEVFLVSNATTVTHLFPRDVPVSRLRGPPAGFSQYV